MSDDIHNVLFLCSGNSARSIMAEAILNKDGGGRFRAYSAGSHPKGEVNPRTLTVLARHGYATAGLRPKTWNEFSAPGTPGMDFIFTVCYDTAKEICPAWPGHPITAHWCIDDPAAFEGTEAQKERAFIIAFTYLKTRITAFLDLPMQGLGRRALDECLCEIGKLGVPEEFLAQAE